MSYDSATGISTTEILRADGTVVAKTRVGSPAPELGGEVATAKNPVPSLLPWDEIDAKLKGIKAKIDPLPSILGGAASAEIKPENLKKLEKVAGRVGFVGDVLTLADVNGDIEEATELLIVPGSPLIDVDKISDSRKEK